MAQTSNKGTILSRAGLIASGLALAVGVPLASVALDGGKAAAASPGHSDSRLELKFSDDSDITLQGNRFVGTGANAVNDALGKVKFNKAGQLFSQDRASLKQTRADFKAKGKQVPDLSQWYLINISPNKDIQQVADQLKSLPGVQDAYPEPQVSLPTTPNWEGAQVFEQPVPNGIDTPRTPTWPGADGNKVKITDVEFGWNTDHEDLSKARAAGAVIPNSTPVLPAGNTNDYGTAVIGMMSADSNNLARTNSSAGDTILIE